MPYFTGRRVAVTGAGGSIGSELCRRIVADGADRLVLISVSESALYNVMRALAPAARDRTTLVPVLASCCDRRAMEEAFDDVEIVVHAAAHKHLPLCEVNPTEAIRNNVGGSLRVMQAARVAGVEQFCLISTDKAVNPTSIMGATKRLAELIVQARAGFLCPAIHYFAVRFGNVLGSAGSVVPLWREQIEHGGPLTLTSPDCERYFMTVANAVDLVCKAVEMQPDSGTFVFDMGAPRKLGDLAREMIAGSGREIPIEVTGLRAGEKLKEELHHGGELRATGVDKISRVSEPARPWIDTMRVEHLITMAQHRQRSQAVRELWDMVA